MQAADNVDGNQPAFTDRYPSMQSAPQEFRPRSANAKAALALLLALLLVVVVLAVTA